MTATQVPDETSVSTTRVSRAIVLRGVGVTAFAALLVIAAWAKTGSATVTGQALLTGVMIGAVYGLVSMGLTLIFGVLDIVNFAHGAFLAVALYATYLVVDRIGVHPLVALPICVPLMFALGALLHRGVLSFAIGRPLENQLLLTLGISLLIQNGLLLWFGPNPRSVTMPGDTVFRIFGTVLSASRLLAFVMALVLAGLLYVLLRRTRLGTAIRAVAANETGAQLVGIDTRRIYTLTFAIGTACAGAAGVLMAPLTTIEPTSGEIFNIVAFVVVVLGGMGNVVGALVGGFIIGLTEQLGGLYFPGQSPLLSVFVVFVLILFFKPQGLFGRRS